MPGEPCHLGSATTLAYDAAARSLCTGGSPGLWTTYDYRGRRRPPSRPGGDA